ncbi:MAG: ribokinase [Pseudomonadota bacterium]
MILNFGSINIDHVYRVPHMPAPGETLAVTSYERFLGGKGANQSIAIARAGGEVRHIGAVGADGSWALERLDEAGVATDHIARADAATGHAIITVDDAGENQILICGGANQGLAEDNVRSNLDNGDPASDWVLLQNETNLSGKIVTSARARGYRIAYSAAPFVAEQAIPLLGSIDLLVVNAIEARALAGHLDVEANALPVEQVLVTHGGEGARLHMGSDVIDQPSFEVAPVDTTGAGDTFLGSFLALYSSGSSAEDAMRYAAAASAIQVTRPGAADAIPGRSEVSAFLEGQDM